MDPSVNFEQHFAQFVKIRRMQEAFEIADKTGILLHPEHNLSLEQLVELFSPRVTKSPEGAQCGLTKNKL